ncbi:hypothetical protein [Chryseolinea sp. H1M3-3]|uniref:hypothetical protein n=1 Tax=Chryseolinea sp. H1M3-3 TaxID=3034144 RepID=UPI0023EAB7BE|nr:hypothetical protein [Chryseolinea sp. H1M3-3]
MGRWIVFKNQNTVFPDKNLSKPSQIFVEGKLSSEGFDFNRLLRSLLSGCLRLLATRILRETLVGIYQTEVFIYKRLHSKPVIREPAVVGGAHARGSSQHQQRLGECYFEVGLSRCLQLLVTHTLRATA